MRTRCHLAVGVALLAGLGAAPVAGAAGTGEGIADPLIAGNCRAVLEGLPGQAVLLDPRAVAEPIAGALDRLDRFGALREPFRNAWEVVPPIFVGRAPEGEAVIPGSGVADAVTAKLREIPAVATVLEPLVPAVHETLSTTCGLIVRGDRPEDPGGGERPTSPPPGPGASPPPEQEPKPPANAGHWTGPRSSRESSSSGDVVSFGPPVVGMWPFGQVPADRVVGVLQPGAPAEGDTPQRKAELAAGRAETLPTEYDSPPWLLLSAVLLLAVVTAQLVRTWVLRSGS